MQEKERTCKKNNECNKPRQRWRRLQQWRWFDLNLHGKGLGMIWFGEGKKKEERDWLELKSKQVKFHEDFIPKSSIRESICYNKLEFIKFIISFLNSLKTLLTNKIVWVL